MSPTSRQSVLGLAFVAILALPGSLVAQDDPAPQETAPIAVVVHPDSPITALSREELRRLFLGSTTSLADGERVELVGLTDARARFYRSALGMSEDRLKRHWISRVFAGQPGTPPMEFRDADDLLDFVSSHPGAVAFVDARAVAGEVRVVLVDGLGPSDEGYEIR